MSDGQDNRPTRPDLTLIDGLLEFSKLSTDGIVAYMDKLEAENRESRSDLDINRKMRKYIAFVLTGDEDADAQLAADRVKARITELKGALRMTQIAMDRWYAEKRFPEGMPLLRQVVSNALAGEQTTPPHDPKYDTVHDVRQITPPGDPVDMADQIYRMEGELETRGNRITKLEAEIKRWKGVAQRLRHYIIIDSEKYDDE